MTKQKTSTDWQAKIRATLESLTEEEQRLLFAVIATERAKFHMQKPGGINDDLWRSLTEIIR